MRAISPATPALTTMLETRRRGTPRAASPGSTDQALSVLALPPLSRTVPSKPPWLPHRMSKHRKSCSDGAPLVATSRLAPRDWPAPTMARGRYTWVSTRRQPTTIRRRGPQKPQIHPQVYPQVCSCLPRGRSHGAFPAGGFPRVPSPFPHQGRSEVPALGVSCY